MSSERYNKLTRLTRKVNIARKKYCKECQLLCKWEGRDLSFSYIRMLDTGELYVVKGARRVCPDIPQQMQRQIVELKKDITGEEPEMTDNYRIPSTEEQMFSKLHNKLEELNL